MTTLQLTDIVARTAKHATAQYTIHDTTLPRFGLRIGTTTKTFVVIVPSFPLRGSMKIRRLAANERWPSYA